MSEREDWESAFIAVSVALGEPLDLALAALDPAGQARSERLLRGLRAASRDARARALAVVLSEVAGAMEASRLT